MDRGEILERLRTIMAEASSEAIVWDEVSETTPLEQLGFDSLSILDVLYGVEQEFEIEIDAAQLADFETVGELIAALQERLESIEEA
ncbi:MAG: acyl carrier protein [Thermoanaerobaculia bacterium]